MVKKPGRNDPCPCGSGKKYKKCCGAPGREGLPDRRLMERDLRGIGHLLEGEEVRSVDEINRFLHESPGPLRWQPDTELERAQELVYQAWESPEHGERIRLAMEALKVSRECADAYVLLAQEAAETVEQALDLYRRGVEAGERALGPRAFQEDRGHFWGVVETRPYMRAREGLAACLWQTDERGEAVEHYEEMLRLNPNDNQGIRYRLLACLLEMGLVDSAEELLSRYPEEPTAAWHFGRALVHFIREEDSEKAREALGTAMRANEYVPGYLAGRVWPPRELPEHVGFGDRSEAVEYLWLYRDAWRSVPRALDWLRSQTEPTSAQTRPPSDGTPAPGAPMRPREGPAPTLQEWRHLLDAAEELRRLQPWQWMEDDELFGVQDPETQEVGYCCVMGALGEVFALTAFLGPQGYASYRRMLEEGPYVDDFDVIATQCCLMASFEDRSSLDRRDLETIRELGLKFRGHAAWPQFRSHRPGYAPWYLTGQEARFLTAALEQACRVAPRVREGLDLLAREDQGLILVREKSKRSSRWKDTWQTLPEMPDIPSTPQPDVSQLDRLRVGHRRLHGTWEVDLFFLPGRIGSSAERQYYPRAWLCVETEVGLVVGTEMIEPWRPIKPLQETFIALLEKAPRLPKEIRVGREEVKEIVAPIARSLGIALTKQKRLPALEDARRSLEDFLAR